MRTMRKSFIGNDNTSSSSNITSNYSNTIDNNSNGVVV